MAVLAGLFGIQTTQNLGSGCSDVTILFARGTFEPGNVGALVGPQFFDSLSSVLGGSKSLGIQGVDYPASMEGNLNAMSARVRLCKCLWLTAKMIISLLFSIAL